MTQACASLAEAHDAGLLHRDIKPPNLFVSRAADEVDIMKLLDFGIVLTPDEDIAPSAIPRDLPLDSGKLTQVGAMLGTPGFMAPEQRCASPREHVACDPDPRGARVDRSKGAGVVARVQGARARAERLAVGGAGHHARAHARPPADSRSEVAISPTVLPTREG